MPLARIPQDTHILFGKKYPISKTATFRAVLYWAGDVDFLIIYITRQLLSRIVDNS